MYSTVFHKFLGLFSKPWFFKSDADLETSNISWPAKQARVFGLPLEVSVHDVEKSPREITGSIETQGWRDRLSQGSSAGRVAARVTRSGVTR
jgi:hypothetical protein